jgi:hypothetical protein
MSIKDRHRSITVRGLVVPSDWDSEGNPSRASIFTFDEDEYEIDPQAAGEYLLDHTGEEVMVRGHLSPGFRRRKVVLVKSFTVYGPDTTETIGPDADLLPERGPRPTSVE